MELDKILKERRTVKKYFDKDVSWLAVSEVLDAGRMAPSSGNLQNWAFIVIRKKETRVNILKHCEDASWAHKAPVLVVICADLEKAKKNYGERGLQYSIQNCACATMQMMLKAYDLGLSTAWIASYNEKNLSKELDLDKNHVAMCVLALGHGETPHELNRHDLSTMVFFEKFGEKERKGDYAMLPLAVPMKRNVEPMKEKLKMAFENETAHGHKEKVKEFVKKFIKK